MKILGSGKIDDFNKIPFSDKAVKALGIKSGDSVIFVKGGGHTIQVFKAEGANLTNEVDIPSERNDNVMGKLMVGLAIILMAALFVYSVGFSRIFNETGALPRDLEDLLFIGLSVGIVALMVGALVAQFTYRPQQTQTLVSFSGPYSKKRLVGLSKMTSDGRTVTGNLFVNSLFGSNPSHIEARITNADGEVEPVLCKCTKDVPGYCTYKLRIQYTDLSYGKLDVAINYVYSGKAIVVKSTMNLSSKKDDAMTIQVEEGDVEAQLFFGPQFQTARFDETLFDPQDEEE